MKRILSLVLAIVLPVAALAGCKTQTQSPTDHQSHNTIRQLNDQALCFYEPIYTLLDPEKESDLAMPAFTFHGNTQVLHPQGEPQSVLHYSGKMETYLDASVAYPLAVISSRMLANPFSNFNLLVQNGWITPRKSVGNDQLPEDGVVFDFTEIGTGIYGEYNAPSLQPAHKEYAYSYSGCIDLLQTIRMLENTNIGTTPVTTPLHPSDYNIHFSPADNCYYSYCIDYNTSYANMFAIYFRSADGEHITNVVVQILHAIYPAGNAAAGASLSTAGHKMITDFSHFAFFMAAETAMTGTALFEERIIINDSDSAKFTIPHSYTQGNYQIRLRQEQYETAVGPCGIDNPCIGESYVTYTYSITLQ